MTKKLSTNEIDHYLIEIENTFSKICEMKNSIKEAENYINIIKTILKKQCDHNKIIDIATSDEHTQYVCSICQQYL